MTSRVAAVHRTDLTALARAIASRPIALLIIDAFIGAPHTLRAVASRYEAVLAEFERSGTHDELITILRRYSCVARNNALRIDQGFRQVQPSPFLTPV